MMTLVRIVAGLHLVVYIAIMWYGWQSYKLLRKPSWKVMGIGFTIFLGYRVHEFYQQMIVPHPLDIEGTLVPFVASVFLLVAFWMLCREHRQLMQLAAMADFNPLRSGAQPVDYWLVKIREIIREEIASASGTTTVTVKGPSATEPVVEKAAPDN